MCFIGWIYMLMFFFVWRLVNLGLQTSVTEMCERLLRGGFLCDVKSYVDVQE